MVMGVYQGQVVDNTGLVQDTATIEVRRESDNGLAAIYSDRAATTPLTNPFDTDSEGFFRFFAAGGDTYKITATKGALTREFRYTPTGLLREKDALGQGWNFHSKQTVTGLTNVDFTTPALPPNVSAIKLLFDIVSMAATSDVGVRLGDAGGFETGGYSSISANSNTGGQTIGTDEFVIDGDVAAGNMHGVFYAHKLAIGELNWIADHRMMRSSVAIMGTGRKTLSDVLTSVRVLSLSSSFDGGNIALWYALDNTIV